MVKRSTPSFESLAPRSPVTAKAARASSLKSGTSCERLLRKALTARGIRYRIKSSLPGHPDVVIARARLAVFCDGDFWHGRNLAQRLRKLAKGHNAPYWTKKIATNVARDTRNTKALTDLGWLVLRYWETDIAKDVEAVADAIASQLRARGL